MSQRGLGLGSLLALTLFAVGCTSLRDWAKNGLKVGPNFSEPSAKVEEHWIDSADPHLGAEAPPVDWWSVFRDPTLDGFIQTAVEQNLDLKIAAQRVLEARAQRNIAAGNLFPSTQNLSAVYAHGQIPASVGLFSVPGMSGPTYLNIMNVGFNISWELDLWGRIRRNIEASNEELFSSIDNSRDVLTTLLADVANNYAQARTFQQRLIFARNNVEIQQGSLKIAEARLKEGKGTALDVHQARSNLAQTQATIPPLEIGLRQANHRLCILLGMPPHHLLATCPDAAIPTAPAEVAIGIPGELLKRRPDVRRALHDAAAQSARIGIAQADFYPQLGVVGTLGYASSDIRHLFEESSFLGLIAPSVQWKILNYGRVLNNVRYQDARFQEKILVYEKSVLNAGREVEDALAGFLQSQVQARSLETSVKEAEAFVQLVQIQYKEGLVDFNRVFNAQSLLANQQDLLATARGNIATNLIGVYRALGGGWQSFDHPAPTIRLLQPIPSAAPADQRGD